MSERTVFTLRNAWFTRGVLVTAGLAAAAALVGFVWLPMVQSGPPVQGIWDAICSAAGLRYAAPAREPVVPPAFRTTGVVVTPDMLEPADAVSIGRGATLALGCTMCHGARGVSPADSPSLAGQYPSVIYKQLADFKSGARASAVMAPLAARLSDQEMQDLAVYYAYLPRQPAYHPAAAGAPPRIVASGAPMRNIPPCGACHGGIDNKVGAAWLEGQPAAYLAAQLAAFASGARHNDIDEQMRNVARRMTRDEVDAAVRYYASQP
jgi:cytochrome c553